MSDIQSALVFQTKNQRCFLNGQDISDIFFLHFLMKKELLKMENDFFDNFKKKG